MRRSDQDIMLNDRGYVVNDVVYKEYLSIAKEPCLVHLLMILLYFFYLNFFD